jgi:hypothetical protein
MPKNKMEILQCANKAYLGPCRLHCAVDEVSGHANKSNVLQRPKLAHQCRKNRIANVPLQLRGQNANA